MKKILNIQIMYFLVFILFIVVLSINFFYLGKIFYQDIQSNKIINHKIYEIQAEYQTKGTLLGFTNCDDNIIYINTKNRDYYSALETFNHEWLHCQWGEHFDS